MPLANREDLIAFRRKMHEEGAAGFAAGPWGTWDEGETLLAFAVAGDIDYTRASNDQPTWQVRPQDNTHIQSATHTGERVATALAMVSLVALLVGTAGVYLTNEPDYPLAATRTGPAQQSGRSVDAGITPLPAEDPLTGMLAGLPPGPVSRHTGGSAAMFDPDAANSRATPVYDAIPLVVAADKTPAPAAPTFSAGVKPGHNGIRTLALPLPRVASIQAVSHTGTPAATVVTRLSTDADTSRGDRFTSAREHVPTAVAVNPYVLPAPAAGDNSVRTNTGIIKRHDNEASPLIPTSATVTSPEPAGESPAKADLRTHVKAAPKKNATTDKPARPKSGRWSVVLGSYSSKKIANRMLVNFRDMGIPAELQTVTVKGKTMHRVRVPGYHTKVAALTGADDLNKQQGIDGAWITKR